MTTGLAMVTAMISTTTWIVVMTVEIAVDPLSTHTIVLIVYAVMLVVAMVQQPMKVNTFFFVTIFVTNTCDEFLWRIILTNFCDNLFLTNFFDDFFFDEFIWRFFWRNFCHEFFFWRIIVTIIFEEFLSWILFWRSFEQDKLEQLLYLLE